MEAAAETPSGKPPRPKRLARNGRTPAAMKLKPGEKLGGSGGAAAAAAGARAGRFGGGTVRVKQEPTTSSSDDDDEEEEEEEEEEEIGGSEAEEEEEDVRRDGAVQRDQQRPQLSGVCARGCVHARPCVFDRQRACVSVCQGVSSSYAPKDHNPRETALTCAQE